MLLIPTLLWFLQTVIHLAFWLGGYQSGIAVAGVLVLGWVWLIGAWWTVIERWTALSLILSVVPFVAAIYEIFDPSENWNVTMGV